MNWHEAMDVLTYWSHTPPPHESLMAGFGIKFEKRERQETKKFTPSKADLLQIMNQINRR